MGFLADTGIHPAPNFLYPVLDRCGERQTEHLPHVPNQNSSNSNQMAEHDRWFGRVFGFIVQLLDPWHPVAFFGALDSIADKHDFAVHTDKGGIFPDNLIPCFAQLFQCSGVGVEKVIQESVTSGTQEKSADKGGNSKGIRTYPHGGNNHNKPAEGCFAGKAGTKPYENFINIFEHRSGQSRGNGGNDVCLLQRFASFPLLS